MSLRKRSTDFKRRGVAHYWGSIGRHVVVVRAGMEPLDRRLYLTDTYTAATSGVSMVFLEPNATQLTSTFI